MAMKGKILLALLMLVIAGCNGKTQVPAEIPQAVINEDVFFESPIIISEMPAPQEEPAPQENLLRTEPITELDMVFVEGGTMVIQGKEVTLDSFFMNKYALTYYIYAKVHNWAYEMGYPVFLDRPMILSSDEERIVILEWGSAIVTCNYLSIMEGLAPVYLKENRTEPVLFFKDIIEIRSGFTQSIFTYHSFYIDWDADGYRLPTEAEWEFAARGGNESMGYIYSGGNVLEEVSSTGDYGLMSYNPGQKKPNELGIHDMSNRVVSEWCIEPWTEPADMEPAHNPGRIDIYNLADSVFLIQKGGSLIMGQDSYRPQARIQSHNNSDRIAYDNGRYLYGASIRLVRNQQKR
jgi:hypothetical protein